MDTTISTETTTPTIEEVEASWTAGVAKLRAEFEPLKAEVAADLAAFQAEAVKLDAEVQAFQNREAEKLRPMHAALVAKNTRLRALSARLQSAEAHLNHLRASRGAGYTVAPDQEQANVRARDEAALLAVHHSGDLPEPAEVETERPEGVDDSGRPLVEA